MTLKKQLLILSLGLFGMTACGNQPVKTMPTEKVMVTQSEDQQLTCIQLEPQIEDLEYQIAEMLKIKRQRENNSFALGTIVSMTFSFLSAPSAHNRTVDNQGFSEAEMGRMESLKQRHHYLFEMAKQKKCGFTPKVEARMEQQKRAEDTMPTGRKRINE